MDNTSGSEGKVRSESEAESVLAPRRIFPVLSVFALILAGCVLTDLGFRLSDRLWPGWLPYSRGGAGYMSAFDGKVLAAKMQFDEGIADPTLPLTVFVGQSTMRSGISAETLQREDGIDAHYLILGGAGGALHLLIRNLDPLRRSSLEPDLVVLGVHYFFLLPINPDPADREMPTEAKRPLSRIPRALRASSWVADRRADFMQEIDWSFSRLKVVLTHSLRLPLSQIALRSTDPWADYPNETFEPYVDMEEELDRYAERLTAAPEAYRHDPNRIGKLIRAIGELRARGAIVALLIEPEREVVRKATPPEAHEALVGPIERAFPDGGVEIINFHDLLAESEFRDAGHYNLAGRERLSAALARRTATILKEYGRLAE